MLFFQAVFSCCFFMLFFGTNLPDWYAMQCCHDVVLHCSSSPFCHGYAMLHLSCLQAKVITTATLTHRQWHLNYYHSIAESAFEVYNLACSYFQLCNLHTRGNFVPIFLDKPGVAGWDTRLGVTEGGWDTVLPPVAEALQCFYPKPALWLADPRLHNQVSHLQHQVWPLCQWRLQWFCLHDKKSFARGLLL